MEPPELAELEKRHQALITELEGAVKRADEAHKKWGTSLPAEGYVKRIDDEIKSIQAKMDEKFNGLETRLNRPGGAPDEKTAADLQGRASVAAFLKFIRKGADKLSPDDVKALVTDDQQEGGYLVPHPLRARIIDELVEISPIRANAATATLTQGDALEVPVDDGAFSAGWVSEQEARTATTVSKFKMKRIQAREMYAMPEASQKMLDDGGFDLESWIARKVAQKFAKTENLGFLKGDNVKEPEGMVENADITVVNSGSAAAMTADGLLSLIFEIPTAYASGASLFMNRKTVLAIRKLKDANNQYLWQPSMTAGNPSSFAGVPVVETPDLADVAANAKVAIMGDLSLGYQIVDKSSIGLIRDPYTNKPFVRFFTTRRTGGAVVLPKALAVQKVAV